MESSKLLNIAGFTMHFGNFIGDATEALEEALAQLEQQGNNSRNMDLADIFYLKNAMYKVGLELLLRNNPQARESHDEWEAISAKKHELQKAWERDILAQEGEEGLKRRQQSGEGPGRQYTPEELETYVHYTQAKVDGGVAKPTELTHALNVQRAGGFYQWDKERKKKNQEAIYPSFSNH